MPGFQQLSGAATGLQTELATLQEFDRRGWIKTVEKNGLVYIAANQRYRAKYILHLRNKKHLSDKQIDLVLSIQQPPYSTAEVDRILREHAPTDGHGAG
ncbi:MAG: hypothetical protein M1541_14370 [Acidobacteria bacterium]|nr:hypothetical protein [Acidobacteriota bacterium]